MTKKKTELDAFWKVKKVADTLGVCRETLHSWHLKEINLCPDMVDKTDGTRYYRPSKVMAYLKKNPPKREKASA